ncbi:MULTISPECIES: hypothetical protein [unclassified Burkholderia]|uniref:hypothetical protein n=1 Tax=unclassified Burkholderia TaxID=2613784 RepID=UPI0019657289|nr:MULTISPECIES: hypothetical protein [unclassified Burkholderia]
MYGSRLTLQANTSALMYVGRRHQFLADKDRDAARRVINAICIGVKVLTLQPQIGRPVDDMVPVLCEWLIDFASSSYVIM